MLNDRQIFDLIRDTDCYRALDATERRKVDLALQGKAANTPRSNIAKAAFALARRISPFHPTPAPSPTNLFETRWGFVRDPASGYETEKCATLKQAGYTLLAFNIGDHQPSAWAGWITHAAAQGLHTVPWARTRTHDDVAYVCVTAQNWGSPALIVNLEQEANDPRWLVNGPEVAALLAHYTGDVGVSTEAWLPANFDWAALQRIGCVCLPQAAVNENPALTPSVVVDRAQQLGWAEPVPSFGTYATPLLDPVRADYVWAGPFGLYTVDDLRVEEIASWT